MAPNKSISILPTIVFGVTDADMAISILHVILRMGYAVWSSPTPRDVVEAFNAHQDHSLILVASTSLGGVPLLPVLYRYARAGGKLPPMILLHHGGEAALGVFARILAQRPVKVLDYPVEEDNLAAFIDHFTLHPDGYHAQSPGMVTLTFANELLSHPTDSASQLRRTSHPRHPPCPVYRYAALRVPGPRR